MNDLPSAASRWRASSSSRYMALLLSVAVLLLAVVLTTSPWAPADLLDWSVVILVAIGAVSIVYPLRLYHDGDVTGVNLNFAVSLTLFLELPDAAALLAATVMMLLGYAVATRSLVKTLVNAAIGVLALGVAVTAARGVIGGPFDGDVLTVPVLPALVLAACALAAVSGLLLTELFHRMGGTPRRQLLNEISELTLYLIVSDVTIAVLLRVLADRSDWAILLALPMFVGLALGYRGLLTDRESGRQAEHLHGTSRQLLDAAINERALDEAVGRLQELFGADHAVLLASVEAPPAWAARAVAGVHRTGSAVLESEEGHTLAAPVRLEGTVMGVLAVGGRRGVSAWGTADLDLLSTVAGEIAATLRTRRLLGELEQERARLVAEKGKLTDVLRSASDGIVVIDADGRIEACNPAMASILGVPDVELGVPWRDLLVLEDEEGRSMVSADDHVLGAALSGRGRVERASAALRRRDGEVRWLRCSAAPVVSDGAADGVVLVAVDVTREHELEQLRGDFIATVSHELRTPLTPLSGFISVLRERGGTIDDDRRTMMVAAMQKQVERLSALISDLLQVADMERGVAALVRDLVSLDATLAEVVELEAVAQGQRDRLRLQVASVDVVGDTEAVQRILRALLSNGLKHTTGLVTVVVEEADGVGVVRVRDEGPRIPASSRQTIFEPFRRLGDHLHRTQGPGLGLSISRSLAEALDGSVEVGATPDGTGNEFVLRLPLASAQRPAAPDVSAIDPAGGSRGQR